MKARIRRLQRERARRRMMKDVPTATAVVVNPTHFAVALRYQTETMSAPLVVAKGKNYLAQRIRQKAIEHQVPIVEIHRWRRRFITQSTSARRSRRTCTAPWRRFWLTSQTHEREAPR